MRTADLHISEKSHQFKNGGVKLITIVPKKTFENLNKTTENAEKMDYEEIQEYIRKHANKLLMDKTKPHVINVLTSLGWRGGKQFMGENFNFFHPDKYYVDEKNPRDFEVYGIQIIEFGPNN